ncbi:hypothetical protein D3C76_1065860 [compost metagenome]
MRIVGLPGSALAVIPDCILLAGDSDGDALDDVTTGQVLLNLAGQLLTPIFQRMASAVVDGDHAHAATCCPVCARWM